MHVLAHTIVCAAVACLCHVLLSNQPCACRRLQEKKKHKKEKSKKHKDKGHGSSGQLRLEDSQHFYMHAIMQACS
jgi:hypothetical protein